MTPRRLFSLLFWLAVVLGSALGPARAVELKVSRAALERTLRQQMFGGPDGRYYLKGTLQTPCNVYAEDPHLAFTQDRIVVKLKIQAKLGTTLHGNCLGITLSPAVEVSLAPEGQAETVGFRDARLEKVSERAELNVLLQPFLNRQVPSGMRVNAADLLRKALADSTAATGYKVSLERLKIHSVLVEGDDLVLDVDGDISIK